MNAQVKNRRAKIDDCEQISHLHSGNITSGFLSSLGKPFLIALYRTIIGSKNAFCIVAEEKGRVIGFISGAESTSRLYKEFLKKQFFRIGLTVLPKLANATVVRKSLEILFYPVKKSQALPDAELLSIVVDKNCRRRSIAGKLFQDLQKVFQERNIKQFKVVVGASLNSACRFYERMGGTSHSEIEIHKGDKSRVYIWDI